MLWSPWMHLPASRVSMMNSAGSNVLASLRPWPLTRTRLASPISDWLIITAIGLLGMWRPFFLMFTRCSPISLGTNEIPAADTCAKKNMDFEWGPKTYLFFPWSCPENHSHQRVRYAASSTDRAPHVLRVWSGRQSADWGQTLQCPVGYLLLSPPSDGTSSWSHHLETQQGSIREWDKAVVLKRPDQDQPELKWVLN